LRKEPDTQVELIDGKQGEFTVLVDGREVARKGDSFPPVEEIKAAVAGAHT
jgi:hypothetical protein